AVRLTGSVRAPEASGRAGLAETAVERAELDLVVRRLEGRHADAEFLLHQQVGAPDAELARRRRRADAVLLLLAGQADRQDVLRAVPATGVVGRSRTGQIGRAHV